MGLSKYDQHELKHLLDKFRLLQLLIFNELFAGGVLDFFEDLGAQNELEGGIDNGINVFGVFLLAAVVQEYVDDFEAKELEAEETGTSKGWGLSLLSADQPVDQGDQVVESVCEN